MRTSKGSVAPKTRKGRTATVRPLTNAFTSISADTSTALRLQRLRLLGIIGQRAGLLADLAWGDAA